MKQDFVIGSSKIEDFWKFINERHNIYLKRKQGLLRPWTDDKIFQQWKFTNVFRELDRGTIALRQMLRTLYDQYKQNKVFIDIGMSSHGYTDEYVKNQFITCILYRMFNWHENAKFGPIYTLTSWFQYLESRQQLGQQIFTNAYMQPSEKGVNKIDTFRKVANEIYDSADDIILQIRTGDGINCTLEHAWTILKEYKYVGPFTAYEFVCDLRYTEILRNATDTFTWCNIGPGAVRGMERLGLSADLESIQKLGKQSISVINGIANEGESSWWITQHFNYWPAGGPSTRQYPYWELREIEHCLCEFDKYERIRLGQGRPRQKFNGMPQTSETL